MSPTAQPTDLTRIVGYATLTSARVFSVALAFE